VGETIWLPHPPGSRHWGEDHRIKNYLDLLETVEEAEAEQPV
jgi:hypothetical protein